MKVKKLSVSVLLFCIAVFVIVGCTPETEFDDMEITKIETSWQEGFAPFSGYYLRTFDFKKGKVYDTIVTTADISDILESTSGFKAEDFNNPKRVATFTQEQAVELYENIKFLGFLAWKDEYITDDIMDGDGSQVSVYFSDGTVKSTKIYCQYPPNYDKILNEFKERFGVNFYYER